MKPRRRAIVSTFVRTVVLAAGAIAAVGCASVASAPDAGFDNGASPDSLDIDVAGPEAASMDATTPDATTPDATTPDATTPDATISCAGCNLAGSWTLVDRRNASGTSTRYGVTLNDDGTALRNDGLAARWSSSGDSADCTFVLTNCTMSGPTNCVEYSAMLDATSCGGSIAGSVLGWMGPPSGTFTMTRP